MQVKQTSKKEESITTMIRTTRDIYPKISVPGRKLEPQVTIGFAQKTPKFVVGGKHTIVYEK